MGRPTSPHSLLYTSAYRDQFEQSDWKTQVLDTRIFRVAGFFEFFQRLPNESRAAYLTPTVLDEAHHIVESEWAEYLPTTASGRPYLKANNSQLGRLNHRGRFVVAFHTACIAIIALDKLVRESGLEEEFDIFSSSNPFGRPLEICPCLFQIKGFSSENLPTDQVQRSKFIDRFARETNQRPAIRVKGFDSLIEEIAEGRTISEPTSEIVQQFLRTEDFDVEVDIVQPRLGKKWAHVSELEQLKYIGT